MAENEENSTVINLGNPNDAAGPFRKDAEIGEHGGLAKLLAGLVVSPLQRERKGLFFFLEQNSKKDKMVCQYRSIQAAANQEVKTQQLERSTRALSRITIYIFLGSKLTWAAKESRRRTDSPNKLRSLIETH
ncbi:hypothetical protein AVEN_76438-1 [Araneus ventricosus]|uniref:Uncharacterized protein n=1 Tax=Araneus ventricosus TaxID=182803 RepID=A0A4Y2TFT3_ARAVE|nr:hypothetical protein AVEN_76438-1 [Araneus ventricosus]